jgi:glyoxylase-like metal-dependent hydrolase (beta-lactamase superfamily II)
MKTLTLSSIAAVLLISPLKAQDKAFYDQVQIIDTLVSGGIHMLQGSGGNIGASVGSDGVLIVDDQFAPLAGKIRATLKQLNPGTLRFIVNTHWHGDHTGGNELLGSEGTIVAQDNVRTRLAKGQTITAFKSDVPAAPQTALPVVTFAQGLSIHFNGEEIKVIHFPHGHTDGDSIIWFTKSGVAHLGDHFFMGDKSPRFPFVDASSGGDAQQLAKNIGDIIALLPAETKVIPGHGPLASMDDLKNYHQMLTETIGYVRSQLSAGKTLDEIKKAGLPEKWKDCGSGFIKTESWIDEIQQSLSK